ncbi:MAG: hypothetical protein WDZ91_08190 [Paenibacillaceae bacterium]
MVEFLTIGWKLAAFYFGMVIYLFILTFMYSPTPKTEQFFYGLYSKIVWLLTIILLIYPTFWFIHLNIDGGFEFYSLFTENFLTIWDRFFQHWQWIVVILLIPLFCRGALYLYAEISVEAQLNKLENEMSRWSSIPYIPPLLYMYVLYPPKPLIWDRYANMNRLYYYAIDAFRESVDFNFEIKFIKPTKKPVPWFRLLPAKAWYKFSLNLVMFAGITLYFIHYSPHNLFSDGYYYFIPLLCGIAARLLAIVFASASHTSWRRIYRDMIKKFNTKEPLIPWTDLRIDQEMSKQIIRAWEQVREIEEKNAPKSYSRLPYGSVQSMWDSSVRLGAAYEGLNGYDFTKKGGR